VELGCGVGGLLLALSGNLKSYLGVDTAFASIALARKLALGTSAIRFQVPDDLLQGAVSRDISGFLKARASGVQADFIVSDATEPALKPGLWDVCASLNMIDMLERPEDLPSIQKRLLSKDGWAIQSSPYVWHPEIANSLRKKVPKELKDSAAAVKSLYESAGFRIQRSEEHVPWIFFKHVRQVELYSVHLLLARSV
jgi:SAM-dependent methyltransferase